MQELVIDGVLINSFCPDVGYEVQYVSRDGAQGGLMLSGEEREDELAIKAIITIPTLPLTVEQVNTLLELLMPTPLHQVRYADPWRGVRTMTAKRTPPRTKYVGKGGTGNDYWKGLVIELREK